MTDWAPWASKQQFSGYSGGSISGSGRKITLHTTETTGFPGYGGGGSAPHLTVNPSTGEARQHIAFSKSAYALASPGPPTSPNMNAGRNIQIEIIAYAKDTPNKPDSWYAKLAEWCNWLCNDQGIPKSFFADFVPNASGATRQSWNQWSPQSGMSAHQNVPYNDHWDAGGLWQDKLLSFMGGAQPPTGPPPVTGGPPPGGGVVPPFPFPAGHWMGQASSDDRNHSGYYEHDRPGISQYQGQLAARGWNIGVDGHFGPESEQVTRQYQSEAGLAADGLAGEQTWHSIYTRPVT
jgi:hypothetical protein